jgi:hypothetical protein
LTGQCALLCGKFGSFQNAAGIALVAATARNKSVAVRMVLNFMYVFSVFVLLASPPRDEARGLGVAVDDLFSLAWWRSVFRLATIRPRTIILTIVRV